MRGDMILFHVTDEEAPPTRRNPVPNIVRIPITWDVADPLNDLDRQPPPITRREGPTSEQRQRR